MPDDSRIKVYVIDYNRKYLVMQWTDPATGKRCTRSARTAKRREAAIKAAELEAQLNVTRATGDGSIPWATFFDLYQVRELAGMDSATHRWHVSKLNVLQKTMQPANLTAVNAIVLSQYVGKLRGLGRTEDTIRGHIIAIGAMLKWAVSQGYIAAVPALPAARTPSRRRRKVKGRNLTFWEFVKMLRAVPAVVTPAQVNSWRHLLVGLWISGLRLNEAAKLSWDDPLGIRINLTGKFPVMEIEAEDDKGREYRLLPITPDFYRWLARTPESERHGRVFRPLGERGGAIESDSNVSRTISAIGEKAGIIVDHRRGKYASAHDLRRTFGTRWAKRVSMDVLQQLMRHAEIETTKTYYVGEEAQMTAATVWKTLGGNTTQNTTPNGDKLKKA